ncbi:hypothetical protein NC653_017346 [Populus alba x Populus x berolinensis]|uniref:Uncharacterized protein n=1 Tax=Populus alba x Populus x berolinensis TaxID=444605 RepID=A0AAD6W0H4_9ROSI|nr:hypothetical protein NC653_017346 [Populus alba x Populus x berolinensis]
MSIWFHRQHSRVSSVSLIFLIYYPAFHVKFGPLDATDSNSASKPYKEGNGMLLAVIVLISALVSTVFVLGGSSSIQVLAKEEEGARSSSVSEAV